MLKRMLIPPLIPAGLIILLCGWVFVSESLGPPRIINGQIDDAPLRASLFLLTACPHFYLGFAILNLLDGVLDRKPFWVSAVWSMIIFSGLAFLLFRMFFVPNEGFAFWSALFAGTGAGAAILIPMSVTRRLLRLRS